MRLFHSLAFVMALLGGIGTLAMMVLINVDVVGRGFFGMPFPATAEIISASIVGIVFLQLPYCTLKGRNIRSAMLLDRLAGRGHRAARILDGVHYLIGGVMLAIIACYAVPEVVEMIVDRETVGIRGIMTLPRWPFVVSVAIGAVLTTIAFFIIAKRRLIGPESIGDDDE